jgi:glycosyltransferase involved in cell wall biosynthesis
MTESVGGNGERAPRILIISPCRNEEKYMRETLDTVLAQTLLPTRWVVVDDGSTDSSAEILTEYSTRAPWIEVFSRADRGGRSVGPGVIEAFYAGLAHADVDDFDYVCKLDLDLRLPSRYFEILVERMNADPRLGSCSGKPYMPSASGELISEKIGDEMSAGMTKFYRVQCFQDIGGFVQQVMWDGIDCHISRMKGWKVRSWDEPELRFVHLRPMGSSQQGVFTGRMRHGFGQYFMGTGMLYISASAVFRMAHPPYLVGGLGIWWGYVRAMLGREPRFEHPGFREFLHEYQLRSLFLGKPRATAKVESSYAARWKGDGHR